jgi:hypothetical protein
MKQVSIKYCSTDGMTADYMTKPLTGKKFQQHRAMIMNLPPPSHRQQQECLGNSRDTGEKHMQLNNKQKNRFKCKNAREK